MIRDTVPKFRWATAGSFVFGSIITIETANVRSQWTGLVNRFPGNSGQRPKSKRRRRDLFIRFFSITVLRNYSLPETFRDAYHSSSGWTLIRAIPSYARSILSRKFSVYNSFVVKSPSSSSLFITFTLQRVLGYSFSRSPLKLDVLI